MDFYLKILHDRAKLTYKAKRKGSIRARRIEMDSVAVAFGRDGYAGLGGCPGQRRADVAGAG